jgi:hypothetical protein
MTGMIAYLIQLLFTRLRFMVIDTIDAIADVESLERKG